MLTYLLAMLEWRTTVWFNLSTSILNNEMGGAPAGTTGSTRVNIHLENKQGEQPALSR